MTQVYKLSLLSVLLTLLLLPVFFLPLSVLPMAVAKITLLTIGIVVALVALVVRVVSRGGFVVPSLYLMWMTLLLPLVYFLSSILSANPTKSLYGYNIETGTFGFMFLMATLFAVITIVFTDTAKIMRALGALLISFSIVTLFGVVKILSGGAFPIWGIFSGITANPIGNWSDYALAFGLVSVLSTFALGVLPMKKVSRLFFIILFALSTILLAVMNFSTAFTLTFIMALLVLVYISKFNVDSTDESGVKTKSLWPAIVLAVVSLAFVINPTVSPTYGSLSDTASGIFGVSNIEVRPSFSATLDISRAVLGDNLLLGSGPGTFAESWFLYKPQEINTTVFWNTPFISGVGFILTQIANVGLVGTMVWLAFFFLLALLMLRAFGHLPEERWGRFALISTLLATLFLWVANFLYVPSMVMLVLTFVLTALFVASCRASGVVSEREIIFSKNSAMNFLAVIAVVGIGIWSVVFTFNVLQRTVSAYHFQQALVLSNTEGVSVEDISSSLVKAMKLVPQDIYYSAFSQLSIARAESVLNATEGTQEENLAKFQEALTNSVTAAETATKLDPKNFRNWISLGSIYSSLVPAPFSVEGAHDKAEEAFKKAEALNPQSPEIPLLFARLELNNVNIDGARTYINKSIALKEDYADAYFLLTQIEINENNITEAIRSAERSAVLSPDNAGVFFQLGLLKYTADDFSGSVSAFEQALRIVPDYANAKYFLGLALDKLGRREEAIAKFVDLSESNPDNAEVKTILENLRAGKDALDGVPSPKVEDRSTPPITDGEK